MKATFVLAALAGLTFASPQQYVSQISDNQPQAPAPVPYTPYASPSSVAPAPAYTPTSKKSACTPKKSPTPYSPVVSPVMSPSTYNSPVKTTPAPYVTPSSAKPTGAILTQISDNQPQAPPAVAPTFATSSYKTPTYATPTTTRVTYQSGNAAVHNVAGYGAGVVALAAGILMA